MNPDNFERRRYPRFPIDFPVEYWRIDISKSRPGRTGDISEGGVLLYLPEKIAVGQNIGGSARAHIRGPTPRQGNGRRALDSAHPDMGLRLLACLPPELASEPENLQYLRQYFIWMSDSSDLPSFIIDKNVDIRSGMQQARAVSTLGDLPLVVISQGLNVPGLGLDWGPLPRETEACLQQTWQDMQGELAGLSYNVTRVTARGGHMFPVEEPELVIQAIIDLVEQLR